jgi:hypothetical protein
MGTEASTNAESGWETVNWVLAPAGGSDDINQYYQEFGVPAYFS